MDVLYHSSFGFTGVPAYSRILLRQVFHLRTVIVTADIDEGFGQSASRLRRETLIATNMNTKCHRILVVLSVFISGI